MTPEQCIDDALSIGVREGLAALNTTQRAVFLISEAEVLCDMEGIDAFVDNHGAELKEAADAFAAVGAMDIANALQALAQTPTNEFLLDKASLLITSRVGYDYETIRCMVQARLAAQA